MSYTKQVWVNGGPDEGGIAATAERLNHIEDGIAAAHDAADTAQTAAVAAGDAAAAASSGLASKADVSALAAKADVSALDNKSDVGHTHTPVSIGAAAAVHAHAAADVSDSTATGRSVLTAASAAAARTVIGAVGDADARLSDARTPTTHTHPVADLTATGTKDSTTFLRGDGSWAVPAGGSAATPGYVLLDDFAGANDDAKLTAALSAVAADTYPRTIQLINRQYSFVTGNRVAFEGMRIMGPRGYGNPERNSQTKMPGRVHLSMTGAWFRNPAGADAFQVSLHNLSFTGGSSATVLGQNGGGTWYCLSMRDIFASGLKSVLGTQATSILLTAASFTGDWEINNCYSGAFHIGGSDNNLWTDGMLLDSDPAFNTAGSANGQAHLWLDYCENSHIGPLYVTAEGPWTGVKVSGPGFGSTGNNQGGPLTFYGMRLEGRNKDAPSNGALFRMDGGIVRLRDCWISYGMVSPSTPGRTPADAGIIHQEAGQLLVDGCTYDRATGVAETVPFVYTASTGDTIVKSIARASRGGTWTGRPRVAKAAAAAENRITDATVTLIAAA